MPAMMRCWMLSCLQLTTNAVYTRSFVRLFSDVNFTISGRVKLKFHLACHVTSRHDTFDVSSESRRACRACRVANMADDEQAIVLACTVYKFSRFYGLTYTQILFVLSNEINVYFNKLVNNLHNIIIILYK